MLIIKSWNQLAYLPVQKDLGVEHLIMYLSFSQEGLYSGRGAYIRREHCVSEQGGLYSRGGYIRDFMATSFFRIVQWLNLKSDHYLPFSEAYAPAKFPGAAHFLGCPGLLITSFSPSPSLVNHFNSLIFQCPTPFYHRLFSSDLGPALKGMEPEGFDRRIISRGGISGGSFTNLRQVLYFPN